eukprot:XP_001706264.1 Hypothetical protein GL50803_39717 [Giardia lamblia ATCC 50803]
MGNDVNRHAIVKLTYTNNQFVQLSFDTLRIQRLAPVVGKAEKILVRLVPIVLHKSSNNCDEVLPKSCVLKKLLDCVYNPMVEKPPASL